jgi:cysteine desulfurase/selenocysteine lyase
VALAEAIRFVDGVGVDLIFEHNMRLANELTAGLGELGANVISPSDDVHRTGIVSARFPGRDGEEVASWLNRSGVIVSPRFGSTRFSVHLFNTSEDVAHALRVLGEVLERDGPWART